MSEQLGYRLAVLYAILWFIDLLDGSILNIALPRIADLFGVNVTDAEWAILGFLLALSIAIPMSSWLSDRYGVRQVYLTAQGIYTLSSLACGLVFTMKQLIFFRVIQGFGGGILIPVGAALIIKTVEKEKWAHYGSRINMVSLLAPSLGPLFGSHVTEYLGWRWLFFLKWPLSAICLYLSYKWVNISSKKEQTRFDWWGFLFSSLSIALILVSMSMVGNEKYSLSTCALLFLIGLIFLAIFLWIEQTVSTPMVPLKIFYNRYYSVGNMIQCAANTIFLGANFLIALFLQKGLGYSLPLTGLVMGTITLGMFISLPFVSKFYNLVGPLPFIIPGLIILGSAMLTFALFTPETSPWLVALTIFFIGFASSSIQLPNYVSIFSEVPNELKGIGMAIYNLFKQLSASFGVGFSTMLISLGLIKLGIDSIPIEPNEELIPIFRVSFLLMGCIPLAALWGCRKLRRMP